MIDIIILKKYHYILSKLNLLSTNLILAQEWHPTKNGSLTPNDVTPGSNKKVWWLCKKDSTHEWTSTVNNRTSGNKCPHCAGRVVNSINCLAKVKPKLSEEWHPAKNGSLTPNDVTPGSGKKVWWLCKKNNTHEWKTTISNRTHGYGCPYCTNRLVNSQNNLATLYPQIAKEWHPTKNTTLSPQNVTPGSDKKIWWLCRNDNTHEWKTAVYVRTMGKGCPYCSNRYINLQNCLATKNPKLAKEWHPTKNGSMTPKDVTPGSHKKVWWQCEKDGAHEWATTVKNRTHGYGCPYCTNRIVNNQNCLAITHPNLTKE